MKGRWIINGFLALILINNNGYSMRIDKTIKLADGKILGYAEYGDSFGYPVFYFHFRFIWN